MGELITIFQYLKRVKAPSSQGATQKTKGNTSYIQVALGEIAS